MRIGFFFRSHHCDRSIILQNNYLYHIEVDYFRARRECAIDEESREVEKKKFIA